ncbi:FGGY family carbohydrate kinase [Nonomuraea typhae]|uniref:Xylulose kinase n=1 Tax=Nonomuraea typhae TaxID=2603600 RepID=A0ABW7Z9L4_9ACTN
MTLVAGVDSSTQSCKVVIRDAETGALVRQGRAAHPAGTEVDPEAWWRALREAIAAAGGLAGVSAMSIAGQQHGMVCLDAGGRVVRDALLWNDVRSAGAAGDLVRELGAAAWAERVGSVPVASLTVTKLRWLAEHEPANAARVAAVCLPHDWLTWRMRGAYGLAELTTDRSDASGTGYFDSTSGGYCGDLLRLAFGRDDVVLPRVLGPYEHTTSADGLALGAGAGDNAAAMLGVDAGSDVVVSVGTSGVLMARHHRRPADPTGTVAGFADATGGHLPLVCTLNAARVLDAAAAVLGVDLRRLSDLALSAPPGAQGLTFVPYLEGERTPNRPHATGALHGLTAGNTTPAMLARAAIEGMLCGLAAALEPLAAQGVPLGSVRLIGGAAVSPAVRQIAPSVFGLPVLVPAAAEYVADGMARQAARVLLGEPPAWHDAAPAPRVYESPPVAGLRERYAEAADHHLSR